MNSIDAAPTREYFYVGGKYINVTVDGTTSQYMVGQIYVEKLAPPNPSQETPIIFIAGSGQTGTNFLNTPDGRPGWSSYFLSKGYTVYLTDQPSRGRSPWLPGTGAMTALATYDIESAFTATAKYNLWPQAKLHTQWPGTGQVGDPIFDAFYATQVQLQADRLISEETNAQAYSALMDRVGEAYLISHSQAGSYGFRVGDMKPDLVKGIVSLEPSGPPFEQQLPFSGPARPWGITDLEIEYEPSAGPNATNLEKVVVPPKEEGYTRCILQAEPAKKLKNLSKVPVLVVTSEASYHIRYDHCTVQYLRQAGVEAEHLGLGKEGIHGNGHMFFLEKNNLEIAERVFGWLAVH
ncbi:alpha/beta-hydrolase [Zopfia rhizophila CBS 207.26]|uniref:Alpha/beta-hydrolase n=1 Tax=Zopfia rhizophila CBS 207.26 TaxID=1314779 RepID=A0A6A6DXJ3_9PEZI|nr:alpha/beta-hydrolase [Zopfia rhizophila CBS 207.26]